MKSSTTPLSESATPKIQIVLQTAFLGDLLLAVPLLTWVKKLDPQTPLGLICRKGLGSTLLKLGIVDYFWEIEKGNRASYKKVQGELKKFHVTKLISAHTSFRTTLFCAGIRAEEKITFAKLWNFLFFKQRIHFDQNLPEALRLLSLLKNSDEGLKKYFDSLPPSDYWQEKNSLGQLHAPPAWADPNLALIGKRLPSSELTARFHLENKKWIALFPGSVWATKIWKKSGYMEVGKALAAQNYQIVVMGGPDEKQLGQEVADAIPNALNLCGVTSLFESLMLLSSAQVVIGNDSSSSHMAALLGIPVVAVFGPTSLQFGYRPWAKKSAVAELESLACRPCGPHGHRKCPLGHHKCMQDLEAREVLRIAQAMIP